VHAVNFVDDANAYEALSKLKELDGQGQIGLAGAAVVVRADDGSTTVKDEVGDPGYIGAATGAIVGLVVGILGGPFGVLLGGATGVLIGSLYDMEDADDTESALEEISRTTHGGHTALLAHVSEQSPDVVNAAVERLGGTVVRRPLEAVEAEIAAAEDAQRAAKEAARKHLHEQQRAQAKETIQAKLAELKASCALVRLSAQRATDISLIEPVVPGKQPPERQPHRRLLSRLVVSVELPNPISPPLVKRAESVPDRITAFAGPMTFVCLHIIRFGCWIGFGSRSTRLGQLRATPIEGQPL
jgi:uncharacterized membrane protein